MLSQENIEKLNMNGLYECKPDVKYRGRLYEDNLYHCCNWTFTVNSDDSGYYMRDTYWNSGDSMRIYLNNRNIDEFELIFDLNKVKQVKEHQTPHYKNYYRVAIDSGGISYPKYFVDTDAKKDKDLIIKKIEEEINECEYKINYLKERKQRVLNGEINLEWC